MGVGAQRRVLAALALAFSLTPAAALATPAPLGQITEFSAGLEAGGRSHPFSIAPGADGNLWFTDVGATAIGRITTSGTISEFSAGLNAGSAPTIIEIGRAHV